MPTYRIQTSQSSIRSPRVLYGLEINHQGVKFIWDQESKEVVFEAVADEQANTIFDSYISALRNTSDKWSASLQLVMLTGGLAHRIRTLRTIISPR